MATARDIMRAGVECIGEHETLQRAAARLRELDVGALPICGDDDRLHGMVTDRDIVVKCVAVGGDPAKMTASELAQGRAYWIDANADLDDVLAQMQEHQIRRLPVIEEHRLVGIISEADLGRHLSEVSADKVGHFVEAVSA
jgi:CBS domain-containing protein